MSPPNWLYFFQRPFPSANMVLIKGKRPILFDTGDEFDTGDVVWRVIHTPGHTSGHISLYAAEQQLLICGDVIHRNDVAWLNRFAYGPNVIDKMLETVQRLASLPVRCSGSKDAGSFGNFLSLGIQGSYINRNLI
jgi:glyoxylase-like metal-dependent hydrolase (beta-lactamase superfamily II)